MCIEIFTAEAALLAATRDDGTIGYAEDTGLHFTRQNGLWTKALIAHMGTGGGETLNTLLTAIGSTDLTILVSRPIALAPSGPTTVTVDFTGAFAIQVANVAGELQTTFIPICSEMMPAGPSNPASDIANKENAQAALFERMGEHNSAHYCVIPAARIGPELPVRTYLGKETDQCSAALLAVEGVGGFYSGPI